MSKSNSFETDLLGHIFNNTAITDIGDVAGLPASASAGNLYIRLYTDAVVVDDATIGTECAYTGYVAKGIAVPRSVAGWTISGNNVSNAAAVSFEPCTAGVENVRYFAVWKDNVSVLDADRLYWGQLNTDLAVSAGVRPEFAIGSINVNEA